MKKLYCDACQTEITDRTLPNFKYKKTEVVLWAVKVNGKRTQDVCRSCVAKAIHKELFDVIKNLTLGMEAWAMDEDGVHYDAWKSYEEGKKAIGEKVKEEQCA